PWQSYEGQLAGRHLAPLAAAHSLEALVLSRAAQAFPAVAPPVTELLLSDNEPRDVHRFVRLGQYRLRRLEGYVVDGRIRRYGGLIHAYMKERLASWSGLDAARPPAQVILLARRYHINEPGEPLPWTGPHMLPLARWQPARSWSA